MEGDASRYLPEDFIPTILSLTTAKDVCRSACVSWNFRSAADDDAVWERFLPSDYQEILARSDSPVEFTTKKELYFRLCKPILLDDDTKGQDHVQRETPLLHVIRVLVTIKRSIVTVSGFLCKPILADYGTKSFWLDKPTGKKCYVISATQLDILSMDTSLYWNECYMPISRFSKAVVLNVIWLLRIDCKIQCSMLSPKTTYVAYLVLAFKADWEGLGSRPTEFSIQIGNLVSNCNALLYPDNPKIVLRGDAWLEIELGKFYNNGDNGEVLISILNVHPDMKRGLIVEGVEVRPEGSRTKKSKAIPKRVYNFDSDFPPMMSPLDLPFGSGWRGLFGF